MRLLLVNPTTALSAWVCRKCSYEIVNSAAGVQRKFASRNGFFDGVIIPPDLPEDERERIKKNWYVQEREIPVLDDDLTMLSEWIEQNQASA